jgi:uncharacterized membrane protein
MAPIIGVGPPDGAVLREALEVFQAEAGQVEEEAQVVIGNSGPDKKLITEAIRLAEAGTSGEIRVHLSYQKKDQDLLSCANALFHELGMQNTKLRNGTLLYLNPKVRKFAIFGDQGIHEKVGPEFWTKLASEVSIHIREKDITDGIVYAVSAIGAALRTHFPSLEENPNELSDQVTED